jgi:hypothetical protein
MKICYFCDFENFTCEDFCERCNNSIIEIRHEIFNIPSFWKRNYQLYAIFAIFFTIYEYLTRSEVLTNDQKYIVIVPLIVAIYLFSHLTYKAWLIVKSRQWQNTEELTREKSFFEFIGICGIHVLLIIVLLVSLPKEARDYFGFLLGMFIFLIFFFVNYSYEQYRKTFRILVWSVLFFEIFIILLILIPFLAKITNNELFAFYYTWVAQISLYLAIGGFLAYALIAVGYNTIKGQYVPLLSILQQERERGNYNLELLLGIDVLIGIVLCCFIFSLKQLYAGL